MPRNGPGNLTTQLATIPAHILYYTCRELDDRKIALGENARWRPFAEPIRAMQCPRVTFAQSQALIVEALKLTDDDNLGLDVGLRPSIASIGPLAAGFLASETHYDALLLGAKYHRLTGSMLDLHLQTSQNGSVSLVARSRFANSPILKFLVQELFANIGQMSRYLYRRGNATKAVEVIFNRSDPARFRAAFGCDVVFGASENRMIFRSDVLNERLETADEFALKNLIPVLDSLMEMERTKQALLEHISVLLYQKISDTPSMSSIANELGMSERSLRRKLELMGTSYRDLIGSVRQTKVMELIRDTNLPVDEIAHEVGYEDSRSLRRNVTQWFGATPTQLRREARGG